MRTTELRNLTFPDTETRKTESQSVKTVEEGHDFMAVLQSVQKDTPPEEFQARPEGINELQKVGEELKTSEEPVSLQKKEISEEVEEEQLNEEIDSEEQQDNSVSPKSTKISLDEPGIKEISLSESIPHQDETEDEGKVQQVGHLGLSLISLLLPHTELEHKEEIFQARISAPPKESLLPPKEKFSGEEKKETNDLLKAAFEGKNQKIKQEEKQIQSKTVEEPTRSPILSARAVVEEMKQGIGSPKPEEGFKFSALFQNRIPEDEGTTGKKS